MKLTFELYSRTGCHLCEAMELEVSELETKLGFRTDTISIDNDERLESLYGDKVPVLAHGEDIICQYFLDEDALGRAIERYS